MALSATNIAWVHFLRLIVALIYTKAIVACLMVPLFITNILVGKGKKALFNKVDVRFLSYLIYPLSITKYATMFENSTSPLGHHLKIF